MRGIQANQGEPAARPWLVRLPDGAVILSGYRLGLKPSYSAGNSLVGTGTIAATVTSIASLFHSGSDNIRREINSIDIAWGGGNSGTFLIALTRISAENAAPGGTAFAPIAHDGDDMPSTAIYRAGATGAPVRAATDAWAISVGGSTNGVVTVSAANFPEGKPFVIRAGQSEGWEVRTKVIGTLSTQSNVSVSFHWTEV